MRCSVERGRLAQGTGSWGGPGQKPGEERNMNANTRSHAHMHSRSMGQLGTWPSMPQHNPLTCSLAPAELSLQNQRQKLEQAPGRHVHREAETGLA